MSTLREVLDTKHEFHPQLLSDEENEFLADKVGENPAVALQGGQPIPAPIVHGPNGQPIPHAGGKNRRGEGVTLFQYQLSNGRVVTVNRRKVDMVMRRFRDMEDAATTGARAWCGYDAIRDAIRFWLDKYRAEFRRMKEMDPKVQHPSRFAYDSRGNPIAQGIGSDSGYVKTWIDSEGKRHPFGVSLTEKPPSMGRNWFGLNAVANDPKQIDELVADDPEALQSDQKQHVGPVINAGDAPSETSSKFTELIVSDEGNWIECPVCGHRETWKEGSQGSKNLARARMSRHCTGAKEEVEAHRLLKYEVFGD